MKNKIRAISDWIFSFVLFLTVFFSISYGKIEGYYLPIFCFTMTFLSQAVYLKASNESYENHKEIENFYNYFVYTKVDATQVFYDALKTRYDIKREGDMLTVGSYNIFVHLSYFPLSVGTIINSFKNRTKNNLLFVCFDCDKQAKHLCSRLPAHIDIMQKHEAYKLLKTFNANLKHDFSFSKKNNLLSVLPTNNAPKISKGFVVSACVILLFSFISPLKTYYQIFALAIIFISVIYPLILIILKKRNLK